MKAGPAAAGKAPTEPVAKRNFDPNQPRDEHGMWTTEGGSETEGTTKPNESDAPATREHNQGTDTVPAAMQSLALADIGTLVAQTESWQRNYDLHIPIERLRPLFSNS